MSATRKSGLEIGLALLVVALGAWLWARYASAWDLGHSSPVLSYDAAQYAVAARELADHGSASTLFALPIELVHHPRPPWPLALVQPGLVLFESMLFTLRRIAPGAPESREWLALVLPVLSYIGIGLALALGTTRLVLRHGGVGPLVAVAAGGVVTLGFLLDPESQHFAVGGFTELPFTLGLVLAMLGIALGWASRRPLLFGLLLGLAGTFRGNMLWLAPILAAAAASTSPREQRLSRFAFVLAGYALPLLPWWIYKWRAFGSPAWDLSMLALWDGIDGRTWFSLNHLPEVPEIPTGTAALTAIAAKIGRNLPTLLLELARGPRALWLGALVIGLAVGRGAMPRAEERRAASVAALGVLGLSLLVGAASVPVSRYLFPARVVAEAAGLLVLWQLIARAPELLLGTLSKRVSCVGVALIGLTWGVWETGRGWENARGTAEARGVPSARAMHDLAARLDRELAPNEPVMSNLGPVLAWYARRPVVHLALSPDDVDECRRILDVRRVLLVFREPGRAWSEWSQVLERPQEAEHRPEWNIARAVRFDAPEGFIVIWLELGPLGPSVAAASGGQ